MIPTYAGARDFPILPAAGPRHAGQYQKSTYAAGKSRIFSAEDHAPHRSEKRIQARKETCFFCGQILLRHCLEGKTEGSAEKGQRQKGYDR